MKRNSLFIQIDSLLNIKWIGPGIELYFGNLDGTSLINQSITKLFDKQDKSFQIFYRWTVSEDCEDKIFNIKLASFDDEFVVVNCWKSSGYFFLKLFKESKIEHKHYFKDFFWDVFTKTFPGGLLFISPEGQIYEISLTMAELLNAKDKNGISFSKNYLYQKNIFDLITSSSFEQLNSVLKKGINRPKENERIVESLEDINIAGKIFKVYVCSVYNQRELIGHCFYFFDITNEVDQKNQIEEQQQQLFYNSRLASLGEMAGGIAHEINNPLAIISMSMQVLDKIMEKGELKKDILVNVISDVQNTVQRITKIVKGLKNLSRTSSSSEHLPTALKDIFNDVLELSSEKFRSHDISLDIQLDEKEFQLKIICDRVQFSQVFLNILGNAFDAIEELEEKWIKVNILNENDFLTINFIDSGKGVPPLVQQKMFDPFFTSKDIGKGTGLGLSISKSIIEKHGGELGINNQHQNTCFFIKLPKSRVVV